MDDFQSLMKRYPDLQALYLRRLAVARHAGCAGCKEDQIREEFTKIGRERFARDNPTRR